MGYEQDNEFESILKNRMFWTFEAITEDSVWEKEMIEQLLKSGVRGIHWIVD